MLDSMLSSMLFIKPSERRDLVNERFLEAILDFIPVAIMDIDNYPDDNFSAMKGIYQINDRLERYLSSHLKDAVIGISTATIVASADVATDNHVKPRTLKGNGLSTLRWKMSHV